MWRRLIIAVTLAAATGGSLWAQSRSPEVQFKVAQEKEEVEGDLKEAIKEYEKVVSGKDRALGAQALLRIADIHRRLGDSEANKAYERLIREFKEQTDAVSIARARLNKESTPPSIGLTRRFIPIAGLAGVNLSGTAVSADGRYAAYITDAQPRGEAVVVHDLRGGTVRTVSPAASGTTSNFVMFPVFSPDGRQLAYSWTTEQGYELRVVNLQESGLPRVRTLLVGRYIQPFDWTPDGRSIVVAMVYPDKSADIDLIDATNGAKRVVAPIPPGQTIGASMLVSADGRFLARDHRPSATVLKYDIYVQPLDGGPEIRITDHPAEDRLVGWAADGTLLFTSDRSSGVAALYAQPVQNGKTSARPTLILSNIGGSTPVKDLAPLRVTKSGAIYYLAADRPQDSGIQEIELATFDFGTWAVGKATVFGAERRGLHSVPAWSRDGRYLAYRSAEDVSADPPSVIIASFVDGTTRELRPNIRGVMHLAWSPDGRYLLTDSLPLSDTGGIYKIDVQTGDASVVTLGQVKDSPAWLPDGSHLVYRFRDASTKTVAFVEHDLTTGSEREIIRRPTLGDLILSPDGRYIATGVTDAAAKKRRIQLIPVAGGEPRVLKEVDQPQDMGVKMWTPDSRSVVIVTVRPDEVWRLPIDGAPVRLPDELKSLPRPAVHPDGNRIAVARSATPLRTGVPQRGVWVLENVLPKTSK